MKTGIELIAIERKEQIEKHGRGLRQDVLFNDNSQLAFAAKQLLENNPVLRAIGFGSSTPQNWEKQTWGKIYNKPYKDRLIIAGALIAAELDRLNYGN